MNTNMPRVKNCVRLVVLFALMTALTLPFAPAEAQKSENAKGVILITDKNGATSQTISLTLKLRIKVGGVERELPLSNILSIQFGSPASEKEADTIITGLASIQGKDRVSRDLAVEGLTDIGVPVLSPLIALLKDTDLREPSPLYKLFSRVMPGYADNIDRNLDMIRLVDGETVRGTVVTKELKLFTGEYSSTTLQLNTLRRIAMRREIIEKTFEVHCLRNSTQTEFLDAGITLRAESKVVGSASGFARLSFNEDGWTSGPDGKSTAGPRHSDLLVDGFPYGALVGRVGASGKRWLAGSKFQNSGLGFGRLAFAINDNEHWQNNVGSYRLKLRVYRGYDTGDPQ